MAINYPSFRNTLTKADMGIPDYAEALNKGLNLFQNTMKAGYTPRNLENEAVSKEQSNQINAPYAAGAQDVYNLDVGQKQVALKQLLQSMAQKKQEYEQEQFLNNTIRGGRQSSSQNNVSMPSENNYSTPNDLNITKAPGIQAANDYSDNGMPAGSPGVAASASAYDTFPGRRTQKPTSEAWPSENQEATKPMNMELNTASGQEKTSLAKNISEGISANEQTLEPGNPALENLNNIWENYPEFRKKLESRGFKKDQTVKYDAKSGTTSVTTKYPNGKVTVKTTQPNAENSPATTAIKTANQKTINAIQNARPIINKLIDDTKNGNVPGQWIGHYFHPDLQASYFSDVIQSSDTLAGAFGFPGTNEGLHQAQQTVIRKPRESDKGYEARLRNLLVDMDKREENSQNVLNKGVSSGNKEKKNNKGRMKFNPTTGRLE